MARRGRFRIIKDDRSSDPLRFWPEAQRKKSGWSRFLPLWGGAVGAGLLVGVGWAYLPGGGDGGPPSRTTSIEAYVAELDRSGDSLAPASEESDGVRAHFGFCHTGGGQNCVVDGDTLYVEGVKIRIADIDAPETHEPKCAEEKSLGDRATQRLIQLVNSGEVTLAPIDRDEDSYGRKLRIVKVDGESVGETLVDDGLARWYRGGRRPWC
jgi:endonuclease YncB( thermonuclease family)